MECTATDVACFLEVIRQGSSAAFGEVARFITDWFNWVVEAIKPHLQSLIALGSFAFGLWKWVRYREAALFRRFKELVDKTLRGLRDGRSDLVETICRPAPGQSANVPLFAEAALRRVFLRRHWRLVLNVHDPVTKTDRHLDRALRNIDRQMEWCEMRAAVFREQRATVHLLKGAIASARSESAKTAQSWWKLNNEALTHFRDALGIKGYEQDVQGIEYAAHQLRKLGELGAALTRYEEMEIAAAPIQPEKKRDLTIARAKRYQAEINRLQAAPGVANGLFIEALEHLAPYAPLADRDLLDQAQLHELHGCVRLTLGFNVVASQSLLAAQADYQRLLDSVDARNLPMPRRVWKWLAGLFHDDGSKALYSAAQDGLARVEKATQIGRCDR